MAIELRISRGRVLPWLYGRYYLNGRSYVVNTGVRWRGAPPASMLDRGDNDFEISREAAGFILGRIAAGARSGAALQRYEVRGRAPGRKRASVIARAVASAAAGKTRSAAITRESSGAGGSAPTGSADAAGAGAVAVCRIPADASDGIAIGRLAEAAESRPARSDVWRIWRRRVVARFAEWAAARGIGSLEQLSRDIAAEYIAELSKPDDAGRIRTARTIRLMRDVIAGAIEALSPGGAPSPFRTVRIETLPGDRMVNRRPLSKDEVSSLLRAALVTDPQIHDVILAGLCTGLRRGDVCSLRWDAIRLREGVIRLATSKTGAVVELPILPAMREMLARLSAGRSPRSVFVFPEVERLLRERPDSITLRVKKAFAVAFATPDGTTPDALAGRIKATIDSVTRQRRAVGRCRASTYDFHALRTTFITLAINGGIPVDKLRALTGHRTVDMILRHYYKPRGIDLAGDLLRAMPNILTNRPKRGSKG